MVSEQGLQYGSSGREPFSEREIHSSQPQETESRHFLREYERKEDFKKRIFETIDSGQPAFIGVLGPPSSGKSGEIEELHREIWDHVRQQSPGEGNSDIPDPSFILTYEKSEMTAKNRIEEVLRAQGIIFDQADKTDPRTNGVGYGVEKEANVELILEMLEKFRELQKNPAKKVVLFDGPGNGFAPLYHDYGRGAVNVLLAQRQAIAKHMKNIFLVYKLGNTEMYKKAPADRDEWIQRNRAENKEPWRELGYGGASEVMVRKLLEDEIYVIDELTHAVIPATYAHYVILRALQYEKGKTDITLQDIERAQTRDSDLFSPRLQQIDKIRIKGELEEILKHTPEEYRTVNLLFEFVEYSPTKKKK